MKLRIAYIVSRFPHLPETFILREMVELENQGVEVDLFPLVTQKQDVIHAESWPWLDRLYHQGIFSMDCLKANFYKFLHHPGIYFSTFIQILWFNLPSPKFLLRAIYIFPVAVWMAEKMEALKVDHIHAHYATHPALAAYIISRFTRIPYSFTVHAHDIFVNRTMLRQKIGSAAFVRAISKFNKDFLCRQYGDWTAGKIHVVHCGIRPEMYQTESKKKPGHLDPAH